MRAILEAAPDPRAIYLEMLRALMEESRRRFAAESWAQRMAAYANRPEAFAAEILGSRWWSRQAEVARSVASNRRVAVKSANGVGKTYLAADLALWFLYTRQPSIVLTSAPTWRQVEHLLWKEIHRRFTASRTPLPGRLMQTELSVDPGWYALGMATDEDVKFQGFHAESLLILFDEASGIPETIWSAAEGIAVGRANHILAIGNPLEPCGRFYQLFQEGSGWACHTISALEHPNLTGLGPEIPGAVTAESVEARLEEWCQPAEESPDSVQGPPQEFRWKGRAWIPRGEFLSRVLGEFPDSGDDSLIRLSWVDAALARRVEPPPGAPCRAAADIARFGEDSTVVGVRRGTAVTMVVRCQGADTQEAARLIQRTAFRERPQTVAIDACGIGGAVVDALSHAGVAGLVPINGAERAHNHRRFANRRAELYWDLRERFRLGEMALGGLTAGAAAQLRAELAALKYGHDESGRIQMESKEKLRARGLPSPDHADMLAMLFDPSLDSVLPPDPPGVLQESPESPVARLLEEMRRW